MIDNALSSTNRILEEYFLLVHFNQPNILMSVFTTEMLSAIVYSICD